MVTRRAFFNRKWLLIAQWRPRYEGSPTFQDRGLKKSVAANLDVRRYEVGNLRISSAKHYILSGRFYVVVDDVIRPGTVPTAYRLRVGGDRICRRCKS